MEEKEAATASQPQGSSRQAAGSGSTETAPKVQVGGLKVPFTGISIKAAVHAPEPVQHIATEVKPLTEENLPQYWEEAAEKLGLKELMAEGIPKLGEHPGAFEVDAQTVSFADEFKAHKIDVMEFFRGKTGMKLLDCKVNPRFVEKDEVIYSPEDKYKTMLEQNPHMAELRKLFPLIDY